MGLFFEMAGSIGGRTVGCVQLQGHLRELRSVELFRHREDRGRLPGTRRAVQQQVRQPVLAGEPADGIDDVLVSRDVGELGRPVFLHPHYVLLGVIHGAHLLLLAGVDAGGVHFHRRHVPLSRSNLADLSLLRCFWGAQRCARGVIPSGLGTDTGVSLGVRRSRVPIGNPGDETRGSSRLLCARSKGWARFYSYFKSERKVGRYQPATKRLHTISSTQSHSMNS